MLFTNATQITQEQYETMLDKWFENHYDESIPEEQFWFYSECDKMYVVIDNMGNEFYVENFKNPEVAHAWLRGMDIALAMKLDNFFTENLQERE